LTGSLQATMCQMSQDLIPIPAGSSQRLTAKVKGTTSQATRALNFTVSSVGFALSVWLCVCVCVFWSYFRCSINSVDKYSAPSGNISLLQWR